MSWLRKRSRRKDAHLSVQRLGSRGQGTDILSCQKKIANPASIQTPLTFRVDNQMRQFICKGDLREKNIGCRFVVRIGLERGAGSEIDRSGRHVPLPGLLEVV